jgi:hypothetical protein
LGHVHGLLQRVSEETASLVRQEYNRFEYPATPSYTIFCHSIAEAMVLLTEGKEEPGIYTLISDPPWSWKEILEYHVERNCEINVTLVPYQRSKLLNRFVDSVKKVTLIALKRYGETLRANLLHHLPGLELKSAAHIYTMRAQHQIREFEEQLVYRPSGIHDGTFGGRRLSALSDSRWSMPAKTAQVKSMLADIRLH